MEYFQELTQGTLEQIAPGIRRLIFTLKQVMSIYFQIDPGVVIGQHSHPHEQMGVLIQGKMKWRIRDKETILQAPALYRIPSNEPHQAGDPGKRGRYCSGYFFSHPGRFSEKGASWILYPKILIPTYQMLDIRS